MSDKPELVENVQRLLAIMQALRAPEGGCPWDQQQTFASIAKYTIEEAYEVADAIASTKPELIKDEVADLLFQVIFYAQMGSEQEEFDFADLCQHLSEKLIRRHPHVFADSSTTNPQQLDLQWQRIKAAERVARGEQADNSILANIPQGMAPLLRAQKIQQKCAKVGFDWTEVGPVAAKVEEELAEVMAELCAPQVDQRAVEEEIGDLLFAVVNLARHANVDAETALQSANRKFEQRFRQVENYFSDQQQELEHASLDEMEAAWQIVKQQAQPE